MANDLSDYTEFEALMDVVKALVICLEPPDLIQKEFLPRLEELKVFYEGGNAPENAKSVLLRFLQTFGSEGPPEPFPQRPHLRVISSKRREDE